MHRYVREGAIALAIIGGVGIHLATQPLREQLLPLDEIVRRITPSGRDTIETAAGTRAGTQSEPPNTNPPAEPSSKTYVPAPLEERAATAPPITPPEPKPAQPPTEPSSNTHAPAPIEPLPLIEPERTDAPPEPAAIRAQPAPPTPPSPSGSYQPRTPSEPAEPSPSEVRSAAVAPFAPIPTPPGSPPAPTPEPYRAPPQPAPPASDLEGIISAWQAAAISRMHVIAPLVEEIAHEFAVEPTTIHGIVLSESSYYPDASNGEKHGLLQYTPEVFSAIIEVNSYRREPYHDRALEDDVWSPEASLRAYRIELRALRDHSGITDPIALHLIRASREMIPDLDRYLTSAPIVEQRSRIERRIAEAQRLLASSHPSDEYRAMIASRGTVSARLADQLDAMITLSKDVSGEYLAAYLTNAVAYARVLDRAGAVTGALARARTDDAIARQIASLERRLHEPLE